METSGHGTTWLCTRCKAVYTEQRDRCTADGRRVIVNLRGVTFGGRWLIGRLLGVGGDGGSVWQATGGPAERDVAIKVLPASDTTAAQRFERGARISGMLEMRHITRVIEHGRADEWFYLVMELLEGETLQRFLSRVRRVPAIEVATFADQILQALEYTHASQVVHRDLKPANIYVCSGPDGKPFFKLLDFGISKHVLSDEAGPGAALTAPDVLLASEDDDEAERLHITGQGQILGTPEYMAPEQITGGKIDARSDLYALGVLLYRLATGRLPFEAKTRVEMYRGHLFQTPPPIPDDVDLPADLLFIILRALAKQPGDRWSSAAAMRQAVVAARKKLLPTPTARAARPVVAPEIDPIPTDSRTSAAYPKRGMRYAWWAGAGVILVGVALYFALGRSEPAAQVATPSEIAPAKVAAPIVPTVDPTPSAEVVAAAHVDPPEPPKVAAEDAVAAAVDVAAVEVDLGPEHAEEAEASFNITTGTTSAEVFWKGQSMGMTPLLMTVKASDLPIEVTLKRGGYRSATQRLTAADGGRDIDVALVRLPTVKKPEPPATPGNGINLQR